MALNDPQCPFRYRGLSGHTRRTYRRCRGGDDPKQVTMIDRGEIIAGYARACSELEAYLAQATDAELRARSTGTRWTNEELLFHMVFGYMVVRRLLPLVKGFGHLPLGFSQVFARVLNAGLRPFDWVNYWGSRAASRVYHRHRMARKLRQLTTKLTTRQHTESNDALALRMAFPTRWDPFFRPTMTVAELYAYPTDHFDFHARQLNLAYRAPATAGPRAS